MKNMNDEDLECEYCPLKFPITRDGLITKTFHILTHHDVNERKKEDNPRPWQWWGK